MTECPLCKQTEFTFEHHEHDRIHIVDCKHCCRFVIDDLWLKHFQSYAAGDPTLEEFRRLVTAAAKIGFLFEIKQSHFGRPTPHW